MKTFIFIPTGRNDLPSFEMKTPFNWSLNPYNDFNWCFQLHTLRYLMRLLSNYKKTRDLGQLDELIAWFQDWWEYNNSHSVSYAWHDMATGIRAEKIYQLSTAIMSVRGYLPKWLNEMILEHIRILRSQGFIRVDHNHGLYATHGLRCLAELTGPGMKKIY